MQSQLLIKHAIYALVIGYSIFVTQPDLAEACGPGRGGGRRLMRRKYPPLVQRQYIPNVSENTVGASGKPEGAIKRKDKRFRELVQNRNPDIEFRDDEGTGADRMMSQVSSSFRILHTHRRTRIDRVLLRPSIYLSFVRSFEPHRLRRRWPANPIRSI